MADTTPTIITDEQRARLDKALAAVLAEGVALADVTSTRLSAAADGVRKAAVLAYLREAKATAPQGADAIPAPPQDLAAQSVQALVRAVWEAAYAAARAEVAETVAEAQVRTEAAEDAAAQAQDELDAVRAECEHDTAQLEVRLADAEEQASRDAGAARDAQTAATEARAREGEIRDQLERERERTAALEARLDKLIERLAEPAPAAPPAPARGRRAGSKKTADAATEQTTS